MPVLALLQLGAKVAHDRSTPLSMVLESDWITKSVILLLIALSLL